MMCNAPAPDPLAEHIAVTLRTLIASDLTPPREDETCDLAHAIAAHLRREASFPIFDPAYLTLLMARALWAVGRAAAAETLLAHTTTGLRVYPPFAAATSAPALAVRRWHAWIASRALRAVPATCRNEAPLWILDLLRPVQTAGITLEMGVFRLLDTALNDLADVWDLESGRGVLGLRHVERLAACVTRRSRRSPAARRIAREIRTRCRDKLATLAHSRQWCAVPDLLLV